MMWDGSQGLRHQSGAWGWFWKTRNLPHIKEKIFIMGIASHIMPLPEFILLCYVIWQEPASWILLILVLSASLSFCLGMGLTRHSAVNEPWSADWSWKCCIHVGESSICVTWKICWISIFHCSVVPFQWVFLDLNIMHLSKYSSMTFLWPTFYRNQSLLDFQMTQGNSTSNYVYPL